MKIWLSRDKKDGDGEKSCVYFTSKIPHLLESGEYTFSPHASFSGFISSEKTLELFNVTIEKGECLEFDIFLTLPKP